MSWKDEPVDSRVTKFRGFARSRRDAALSLRIAKAGEPDRVKEQLERSAVLNEERAKELDGLADEMERTGVVIA